MTYNVFGWMLNLNQSISPFPKKFFEFSPWGGGAGKAGTCTPSYTPGYAYASHHNTDIIWYSCGMYFHVSSLICVQRG